MNVFVLDLDPVIAAQYHLDKHVVKMILETAQLLSTAHRVLDGTIVNCIKYTSANKIKSVKRYILDDIKLNAVLYNVTHVNHPCAVWCRHNINNYMWLYKLFVSLCNEYTFRYGKMHKTDVLLRDILKIPPKNISHSCFTPPTLAMPEKYKNSNIVLAYRRYYIAEKYKFAKWTKRNRPNWFDSTIINGETHANI